MKKKFLALALAAATLTCSVVLAACTNSGNNDNGDNVSGEIVWGEEYSIEAAYVQAKALGYSGTLEEFIASISGSDGKDGVGILSAEVNESGNLIITLTDNKKIDCGKVVIGCNHSYSDDWEVVVEPTCTQIGLESRVCDNCQEEELQIIKPIPHNYVFSATVAYDNHSGKCAYCGATISGAHEWEDGECTVCHEKSVKLNFTLSTDKTYYSVSTKSRAWEDTLEIPSTYNDLPVTQIGKQALNINGGSSVAAYTIVIPTSITYIGLQAFDYLDKIIYSGTVEQWNAITKVTNWDKDIVCDYTIECTDGTIEVSDRGISFWELIEEE